MSPWLLPDYIADVLPASARHIEQLRKRLLDTTQLFGYELVIPPMVEYLESLLTGTGEALGLQTFKLVDQLSGRMLGLRADTTPQVARIDAHLLGHQSITRLCYCGPVLHTRPERAHASREPLQMGAEVYGGASLNADLEILELALGCLRAAGITDVQVDLADSRIVRAVLAGAAVGSAQLNLVHQALVAKDAKALWELTAAFPKRSRQALQKLVHLYGGIETLESARQALSGIAGVAEALGELQYLRAHLAESAPQAKISFDLADARGYGYYSGIRFAIYSTPNQSQEGGQEILRGGRYDGVGAVFGHLLDRDRPAVGFSLDLKILAHVCPQAALQRAILAPWDDSPSLRNAIAQLRSQGHTVICIPDAQRPQCAEFLCDCELIEHQGQWIVAPLQKS